MTSPLIRHIPRPSLQRVENLTPFAHFQCLKMGPGRLFYDTVVVKGSFELTPGTLSDEQPAPIVVADESWDETDAARSSLRAPGDALLAKRGTDVFVTGHARLPRGVRQPSWETAVVVRDAARVRLRHVLRVHGPRRWEHRAVRGWTLSESAATGEVPIRYELAYGGAYLDPKSDAWVVHPPNPSGRGFVHVASLDRARPYPAPQWELPEHPVGELNRDVPLAGFGPVARAWQSRVSFAGTYDDAWLRRMRDEYARGLPADYPPDFDLRFFQCAPSALVADPPLRGDEQIGLAGLVASHEPFLTRLPGFTVHAQLHSNGDWTDHVLPLDTVHLDLDANRVHLSWRLTLDQRKEIRAAVLYPQRGVFDV